MKKFNLLKTKIGESSFSKDDLSKNISDLRGIFGGDGRTGGSYSSTYTSGNPDCDGTRICKPCVPPPAGNN